MAFTPEEEANLRQLLAKNPELLSLADNQVEIINELGAEDVTLSEVDPLLIVGDDDIYLIRSGGEDKSITTKVKDQNTLKNVRLKTYIPADEQWAVGDNVIASNNWEYNCRIAHTVPIDPITDETGIWVTAKPEDVGKIEYLYHNPTALELAQKRLQPFDGSSLEKVGYYSALYLVYGNYYGNADIDHYYLPDLSGLFERIWNNGAGIDPDTLTRIANTIDGPVGDLIGSMQLSAMWGHIHNVPLPNSATIGSPYNSVTGNASGAGSSELSEEPITDGVHGTPLMASESRSINIYKGAYVVC